MAASDDFTTLALSTIALSLAVFVLAISLVPVLPPEIIPVLGVAAIALTLLAMALATRSAWRRREYWWIAAVILTGPIGTLAYSMGKATESGILTSSIEELSRHTIGPPEEEERAQKTDSSQPPENKHEESNSKNPETLTLRSLALRAFLIAVVLLLGLALTLIIMRELLRRQ